MWSNVFEYLAEELPEFNRCLDESGFLDALKKRSDLTILIPISYMDEIVEKCTDDDELSNNYLKALILNTRLDSAKDWDSKRDQIINKLNQKVDVKTITKSSITLSNGVILQRAPVDDSKISVWRIEQGKMPLDGQKMKIGKVIPKKVEDDAPRDKLAQRLENKYDRGNTHAFLDYMAVLMRIIKDEDKALYSSLVYMLDPSPIVSFYLFVEPFKNGGFIIPSYILKKVSSKLPNSLRSWKSNFITPPNHDEVKELVDEIRNNITSEVGPKGQLEQIKLAYDEFANGDGIFQKMPTEVQRFYKQNAGIKLWQDGARHLIRKAFDGDIVTRTDTIQEMFTQYNSDNKNTIVTDVRFYRKNGTVSMYEGLAGEFIQSDLLMYIPHAPIVEDDSVISQTWEELEGNIKEYTEIDDDIIRQLREIQENEPSRFEKIMKEFVKSETKKIES